MTVLNSAKRLRGPQRRSEETKKRLLDAAIHAFSTVGYEGSNVAALEEAAGVQRGLLAYHFGTKDALWRAAVDEVSERLAEGLNRTVEAAAPDVDPLHTVVTAFMRANAETPQFMRIIALESNPHSDRMVYIGDRHIRRFVAAVEAILGRSLSVHDYYLIVGAAGFPFISSHEAMTMWNVDTYSKEFIADHVEVVTSFLRARWPR